MRNRIRYDREFSDFEDETADPEYGNVDPTYDDTAEDDKIPIDANLQGGNSGLEVKKYTKVQK